MREALWLPQPTDRGFVPPPKSPSVDRGIVQSQRRDRSIPRLSREIAGEVGSGTRHPNCGEVREGGGGGCRLLWWLGRCGRSDPGGRLRICGRRPGDRGRLRR